MYYGRSPSRSSGCDWATEKGEADFHDADAKDKSMREDREVVIADAQEISKRKGKNLSQMIRRGARFCC